MNKLIFCEICKKEIKSSFPCCPDCHQHHYRNYRKNKPCEFKGVSNENKNIKKKNDAKII